MTPTAELVKAIRSARLALGGMWNWKDREELKEAATRLERYEAALRATGREYVDGLCWCTIRDMQNPPRHDAGCQLAKALQGDGI